ncbi:MAG: bifunctional methylenetetrahydrofolate dehydrogenase/methenyltetrahydrofolate cyclohydrolase FolD [Candidatus Zeuxoniibacter abyssi]|nr:MAG: bifunctional methylenetetrahydrofolate dehydrogenase/methenyltetrahydrofolate cyclohydrolase FolD [Candidatus Persebacteraceae bacterium AB1(2)]
MNAKLIDGKRIADDIIENCARRIDPLKSAGKTPGLAVIMVGENPASQVYVRNKVRACEKAGVYSEMHHMSADTDEKTLLKKIASLNEAEKIHGILLQLPLPTGIDNEKVLAAINPQKDVDGFHPFNIGRLCSGLPALWPCTPSGCMEMLRRTGIPVAGGRAVIIGRSNIVGKPMALMLINAGATVTVCNSQTVDLPAIAGEADILVAAVGRANFISAEMIKPGAVVLDVGINRTPDGLVGDVNFNEARTVAGHITPVPGGVGPMTVAMLISNTVQAAAG